MNVSILSTCFPRHFVINVWLAFSCLAFRRNQQTYTKAYNLMCSQGILSEKALLNVATAEDISVIFFKKKANV